MTSASVGEKVKQWVGALDDEILERDAPIRLAVIGLLSGHHLLLLGEPGTAKTLLAQRAAAMVRAAPFVTLLTKFSTPEDIFGPLSLKGLEEGRYERLTTGYLPSAHVAFVDEIFKANASILNAMLSILNERRFFNGATPVDVPLLALFAASNELPEDDEGLDALDDRLLLRVCVDALRQSTSVARLLRGDTGAQATPEPFLPAEVAAVRDAVKKVRLDDHLLSVLLALRDDCRAAELTVSDRRWRQAVDVMATCAAIDGESQLQPAHLGVLRFVLWRRPAEQAKVVELLEKAISSVPLSDVAASGSELLRQLRELKQQLTTLAEEVNPSRDRYYYNRPEVTQELRDRALETRTKVANALAAAEQYERDVVRVLSGRHQLWRPFWVDVVGRFKLTQEIAEVRHHSFFSDEIQQKLKAAE